MTVTLPFVWNFNTLRFYLIFAQFVLLSNVCISQVVSSVVATIQMWWKFLHIAFGNFVLFLAAHLTTAERCTPANQYSCTCGLAWFNIPFGKVISHETKWYRFLAYRQYRVYHEAIWNRIKPSVNASSLNVFKAKLTWIRENWMGFFIDYSAKP